MVLDEHGRVDAERTAEKADFRRDMERDAKADGMPRYALQYVGPAGHVRYLDLYGELTDNPDGALTFGTSELAYAMGNGWGVIKSTVWSVVNLDDPEERC